MLPWITLAALVAAAIAYAFARPAILAHSPAWARFCAWLDPIAVRLWRNSRTMLVARLISLPSAVVTLHDAVAMSPLNALDWTPVTTRLLEPVPPDLRGMALTGATTGIGLLIAWLRKRTDQALPSADRE